MSEPAIQPKRIPRTSRRERKAARARRLLLGAIIAIVLVVFGISARPLYRKLKSYRANQFAAEAEKFVQEQKWNDAANRYRVALQLDPSGYRPLAGAARLATRTNRPEAGDLWREVMRLPQATNRDRQEYAALLLRQERFTAAEPIIEQLLRDAPDTETLKLGAQFSDLTGNAAKAIEFARLAAKRAPEDEHSRLYLATLLAHSENPAEQAEARQLLWQTAASDSPAKRAALEAIARAPDLAPDEERRVVAALRELPDHKMVDELLAAELQIKLEPASAAQVVETLAAQAANADPPELAELARWLNLHGQSERVLALVSPEKAAASDELLLVRVDALANLQRWSEIDALLERPDLTLDPSVVESFRARSALGRGSNLDAELHWERATALAAKDPLRLRFVASFAEQSGATTAALQAYERLARFPEQAQFASRGRQRLLAKSGDAAVARASAERLAAVSPDDPNAQAELLHYNLLLSTDVDASLEKAKSLVQKFPTRLSFRVTAALGYLRKGDAAAALAQFQGPPINWQRAPPGWRAVYAAVLIANNRDDEARAMIKTIPVEQLNNAERELISGF